MLLVMLGIQDLFPAEYKYSTSLQFTQNAEGVVQPLAGEAEYSTVRCEVDGP
jgi:hypothetical protein